MAVGGGSRQIVEFSTAFNRGLMRRARIMARVLCGCWADWLDGWSDGWLVGRLVDGELVCVRASDRGSAVKVLVR
jgi:hypothetical protein